MAKIIIIGAGGVGQVVAHKCAQMADVFERDCAWLVAPRASAKKLPRRFSRAIGAVSKPPAVDADKVPELVALI